MEKKGKLYLIPVPLGDVAHDHCLPLHNRELLLNIKHFVVENIRSARRFLRETCPNIIIDNLSFYELNKYTTAEELSQYLTPLLEGMDMGIISEAGCPAVADPGADMVALAQEKHIEVIPLVGPSSIIMGLMGSGFNGQRFSFLGYLPIEDKERQRFIKEIEQRLYTLGETQIFIETPYRNEKLVELLIKVCHPQTKLCIACNISTSEASIQTKTLQAWKKKTPPIHKKPTIFLLGK